MNNQRASSWWEHSLFFKDIDILIVGGGIVGLNAAIRIKELNSKLNVLLVERGSIQAGASTRNAGFACFGSLSELIDDLQYHSEDEVFSLVEKRWKGLQRLKERVGEEVMEYQHFGGYELFNQQEESSFHHCKAQITYFNSRLQEITGISNIYQIRDQELSQFGFGPNVKHLILNAAEGQLNPAKMIFKLEELARQKGVKIVHGLNVTAVDYDETTIQVTTTEGWNIQAKKILLANNGFAKDLLPELNVVPARNQVMISQPISNLKIKGCFHFDRGYYYFRNVGNRILLGGARNIAPENEETSSFGFHLLIKERLLAFLKTTILPNTQVEVAHWWSGIMGLGKIKKPIIEEVKPNIFVAVRLGGMGVAIGSLTGEEAAEQIVS